MAEPRKRVIAVAVTHRTPYARLKPVLRAIEAHPGLDLRIIAGVSAFSRDLVTALREEPIGDLRRSIPWYLRSRINALFGGDEAADRTETVPRMLREDGFRIDARLPIFLQGGDLEAMTKSAALCQMRLPAILERLRPDVVLVHADRFEMLPVAIAASFLNIPVAHTQGGEVTGTIDENVRHVITKLASMHFPATTSSGERIVRMGEDPRLVRVVGCPTIDVLKNLDLSLHSVKHGKYRVDLGGKLDFGRPYLLMMQHPVTTEYAEARRDMEETLAAVETANMQTVMLLPNLDAGTDGASSAVRDFIRHHRLPGLVVYKTFSTEDYYRILNGAAVAVGNSSSFIREGSYLGTPAVVVGTRQAGREHGENVVFVKNDRQEIGAAIAERMAHGRFSRSGLYGDGSAAGRIAEALAAVDLPKMKIHYSSPA